MSLRRLSRAQVLAYSAGSLGTGVFSTVPTVLLLYFCTETLGIASGAAALLITAPKLWSIVWDPFVGAWSDRTRSRFGRRRPFLLAGLLGVVVAFVAVFSPPPLAPAALIAWTGLSYFALATVYSLFAVPYAALPAEIAGDEAERARLVSWRMVVVMAGVLAGAGLAPILVERLGGGRAGYAAMSVVIALLCGAAMLGPVAMMRGRDRNAAAGVDAPGLPRQLAEALRSRRFRYLIGAYVAQLTGVGAFSASVPYLVTHAWGRGEGDIGVAMAAMLGTTAFAVPLWTAAGRRLGEGRALALAAVVFAGVAFLVGMLAAGGASWPLVLGAFVLAGLPFAGLQVLPYTLVAHLVHAEAGEAGAEGVFTGVWTATEKLGLAFGPGVVGLALAALHGEAARLAPFVMIGPGALALGSLPFLALAGAQKKVAIA
ncbi:MAG: MFS transporter [Phenylobacterium sp.]|uniref:MFS transporter n=1 Tax=Phenylobacterium sp. TaxID=1871053 RepID=UPI00391A13F9